MEIRAEGYARRRALMAGVVKHHIADPVSAYDQNVLKNLRISLFIFNGIDHIFHFDKGHTIMYFIALGIMATDAFFIAPDDH